MHLLDHIVPLGMSFADEVGANQLISLHYLFQGVLLCLLEEFLSRIDKLLEAIPLLGILGHVEFVGGVCFPYSSLF